MHSRTHLQRLQQLRGRRHASAGARDAHRHRRAVAHVRVVRLRLRRKIENPLSLLQRTCLGSPLEVNQRRKY